MRFAPLSLALLCLSLSAAYAQTVSVASLRVPGKAREHLEKAREAAVAHHDERMQREIAKALELAPNYSEPYLLLADRENAKDQYALALQHGLKAQALDADAPWVSIVIATAYNGLGRNNEAFLILNNLHGPQADTWQAAYETARAEVGRGNAESALRWGELALKRAPASCLDVHLLLANALQLAHRWREAAGQMQLYLAAKAAPDERREPLERVLAHTLERAEEQERLMASAR